MAGKYWRSSQNNQLSNIKNILKHTARDITAGTNAHGQAAVPGPDLATGFGLVDAERAIETLL